MDSYDISEKAINDINCIKEANMYNNCVKNPNFLYFFKRNCQKYQEDFRKCISVPLYNNKKYN